MSKASRPHSSDEFGKSGSSSLSGLDAPMIGASSSILIDAIAERESGVTPPPPAISVRAVVVALILLFLVGVTGVTVLRLTDKSHVVAPFTLRYAPDGTGVVIGEIDGVSAGESEALMSIVTASFVEVDGQPVAQRAEVLVDSSTVFLVNGRPLGDTSASDSTRLTPSDVTGWPARVEYSRMPSSSSPRASLVEFNVSQSLIDDAIENRSDAPPPSGQ